MSYPPEVLHAKQRLLAELGPEGQARLLTVRVQLDGPDEARWFASRYLERAGVTIDPGGERLEIAGEPSDDDAVNVARAALAGALAATEVVRRMAR